MKIVWAPKREKWTGTKIILKNEFLPFLASKEDIPPGATFKVKCWNCGPITVWHNMTSIQFCDHCRDNSVKWVTQKWQLNLNTKYILYNICFHLHTCMLKKPYARCCVHRCCDTKYIVKCPAITVTSCMYSIVFQKIIMTYYF